MYLYHVRSDVHVQGRKISRLCLSLPDQFGYDIDETSPGCVHKILAELTFSIALSLMAPVQEADSVQSDGNSEVPPPIGLGQ